MAVDLKTERTNVNDLTIEEPPSHFVFGKDLIISRAESENMQNAALEIAQRGELNFLDYAYYFKVLFKDSDLLNAEEKSEAADYVRGEIDGSRGTLVSTPTQLGHLKIVAPDTFKDLEKLLDVEQMCKGLASTPFASRLKSFRLAFPAIFEQIKFEPATINPVLRPGTINALDARARYLETLRLCFPKKRYPQVFKPEDIKFLKDNYEINKKKGEWAAALEDAYHVAIITAERVVVDEEGVHLIMEKEEKTVNMPTERSF